jgi:hypothetical protein
MHYLQVKSLLSLRLVRKREGKERREDDAGESILDYQSLKLRFSTFTLDIRKEWMDGDMYIAPPHSHEKGMALLVIYMGTWYGYLQVKRLIVDEK